MNSKRIVTINTSLNCGSTGRIAEQIGITAEANGFKYFFAHGPRYIHSSNLETFQVGSRLSEMIHVCFYSRLLDHHGEGSKIATKNLIKHFENDIHPDLIHLHNIHGYYLNYPLLFEYIYRTKTPVVWTLHDCWPFTGHCVHFDHINCKKWINDCSSCPQKRTYPKSIFLDSSKHNYRLKKLYFTAISDTLTLVPVSQWLAKLVKASFLKDCHINTIHNGIDIEQFHPTKSTDIIYNYNLQNKHILLGVASPWTVQKGLLDFLTLRKILPLDFQIVLVGLTDKQIKQLPFGILGIKRTKNIQELVQWYSAADILINLTYEDNYPTTNLEAMACGTPVITYKTGGSPESVTKNTGYIVEQGNLSDVKQIIESLDAYKREQLRVNCRRHAEQNFDKNHCFCKYIDLYKALLNEC